MTRKRDDGARTFNSAYPMLPAALWSSFDASQPKTLEYLKSLAEGELALAEKGEVELTAREKASIVKFIGRLRFD